MIRLIIKWICALFCAFPAAIGLATSVPASPLGERVACETIPTPVFDEEWSDGVRYRATGGGLEVLDSATGAHKLWSACDGLAGTHITAVEPANRSGEVYFSPRGKGVWRLETTSGRLTRLDNELDELRWTTALTRLGNTLYVGTVQHGLWSLPLTAGGAQAHQPLRRFRDKRVSSLAVDASGDALLIARDLGGLWRWSPGSKERRIVKGSVQQVEVLDDGGVIVQRGIERCLLGKRRSCAPLSPGLPPVRLSTGDTLGTNHITSLTVHRGEDGVKALIAGTYDQGIYRREGAEWAPIEAEGRAPRFINQVLSAEDALWVATPVGAFRLQAGRWQRFGEPAGLPSDHVNSIHVDAAGRVLFATGAGLAILHAGRVDRYGVLDGLPHRIVYGVSVAGERVVAGTADGVAILREGAWTRLGRERDGLSDNWVNAVAVGADGGVLAGTYDAGIDRLDADRFAADPGARGLWINPNGLWPRPSGGGTFACTLGDGLWWQDPAAAWVSIADLGALPSDDVTAVALLDGRVWVGTRNGIAVFGSR